ncbi:hypothetical protein TB147_17735 [Klebsiella aerogenes]|uniref:hypothetical protein n=1 Tax=Klebsiella aerogenes TaxID=548 RepID=UPI002E35AC8D|nr:hypothetical protein [Klebsiella aerogenes]MED7793146.1 hypothetical protein [Klebsiella aerogenes]
MEARWPCGFSQGPGRDSLLALFTTAVSCKDDARRMTTQSGKKRCQRNSSNNSSKKKQKKKGKMTRNRRLKVLKKKKNVILRMRLTRAWMRGASALPSSGAPQARDAVAGEDSLQK